MEQILIFVTACAWIFVMAYAVVWNYLYFTKVLPTLSRDGLDGWQNSCRRANSPRLTSFLPGYQPPLPDHGITAFSHASVPSAPLFSSWSWWCLWRG